MITKEDQIQQLVISVCNTIAGKNVLLALEALTWCIAGAIIDSLEKQEIDESDVVEEFTEDVIDSLRMKVEKCKERKSNEGKSA